ncbi:S41 family peptidase [Paludibacter sp.]|uniref:S41 family peptidase n=1 Tax=Paludibacter sp. TaxID=1898105 RepID=UPI0025F7C479|nr:S41 family peptidase [Paludibacter sp.]
MQKFLACFHNGHTSASMPDYLNNQLSYPLLVTSYNEGKLYIENIGSHYSKKVTVGDEILTIDGMPAMKYINENGSVYDSESNPDISKMTYSMFNPSLTLVSFAPKAYKKRLKLEVKTADGIKKVQIPYDIDINPLPSDSARQNKLDYIKKRNLQLNRENILLVDSVNSFAYIRFTKCDKEFDAFFQKHQGVIKKYDNLIVDITDNSGGDGNAVTNAISFLVDNDSLQWNKYKTRINKANYRAKASSRLYYYKANDVSQQDKDLFYPYFYDTAFEDVPYSVFANRLPSAERYKGNIYVITAPNTASAAEFFAIVLTINPKTRILGKRTAGANGQPLVVRLPSGIEVLINTCKTFDYRGRDVSSGITPDYERDFSDIYKIGKPVDWFRKVEEYVNELSQIKK